MSVSLLRWTIGGLLVVVAVAWIVSAPHGQDRPSVVPVSLDQPPSPDRPQATPPPPYRRAAPPAAAERVDERRRLVDESVARSGFGRTAVDDDAVLEALRTVPRHVFVPAAYRDRAYRDTPLPIGEGQTISQPYIVGLMTQLLRLTPQSKVLEIGTGSGYQAAVLAHLTPHVYSVEILAPLAERTDRVFNAQGYGEITRRQADGYHGWAEHAPYDAIIVTCAAGHLPPPLWEQLAPGGRIVIPIGGPYEVQRLVLIEKQPDGSRRSRTILAVRFVPLTRQ